jgi:CRP/FNR family cyclic AMP-dependent transcriptional regulator
MQTARQETAQKAAMTSTCAIRRLLKLRKGAKVFSQGARADAIFFIQAGKVKVTVTSAYGREAVLRMLGPHDFFGEECLVRGSFRTNTATTSEPSTVFRIERRAMLQALHSQSGFSHEFVVSLLVRNVKLEQDLRNQILNHSEKRLARVLLKLARLGNRQHRVSDTRGLRVTHAILAEIVGVSRSRISVLMSKFMKMGLLDYKRSGELIVMAELLTDLVVSF